MCTIRRIQQTTKQVQTPELQTALANALTQLQMINPATTDTRNAILSDVWKEDAYFGLYANLGASVSLYDRLHLGMHVGFVTWGPAVGPAMSRVLRILGSLHPIVNATKACRSPGGKT